ncbi:hypothetical protein SCUCBS95973_001152 [Sporothrix curviconia]|uniref:Uncharacterized protein n=1 Tax=Sporothrix curviconia TaxID=1260050 RepID=A0ABP0AWF2_9PEZI
MRCLSVLLTTSNLAATVISAPADLLECLPYQAGAKECYKATTTVQNKNCAYTACPGIAGNCRAEWLLTHTLIQVPCENKCCPTTATSTVTQPCQACPTDCSKPLYTQNIYFRETDCTNLLTKTLVGAAAEKTPDSIHGLSVGEIQASMDDALRGLNQKPMLYQTPTKAHRHEEHLAPPPPTTMPGGSLSTPQIEDDVENQHHANAIPKLPPLGKPPIPVPPGRHPRVIPGQASEDEKYPPVRPVMKKLDDREEAPENVDGDSNKPTFGPPGHTHCG